jgi:hypothetical protein
MLDLHSFDWKSPKKIEAKFIEGMDAENFLAEYNRKVDLDYRGNNNLKVLDFNSGTLTGSNTFATILVNQLLASQDIRTATPADIEKIIKHEVLSLEGRNINLAFILRSDEDFEVRKNNGLAKYLGAQVKEIGLKFSSENPIVIPLNSLYLENAENCYGLTFKIYPDAVMYNAPQFTGKNNEKKFFKTETGGCPIFDKRGDRQVYTRFNGLSEMYLDGRNNLVTSWPGLAWSNRSGRIVLVKKENVFYLDTVD